MSWVMRVMPASVRAKRRASSTGVLADDEALGDDDAAVDDDAGEAGLAVDDHVGEDDGLGEPAEGVGADVGEEEAAADLGAGDDAAAGDEGVDGLAAAHVLVVHELGGRELLLVGPDAPVGVVEVERGDDAGEVDVGLPVGVDGADVAPVGRRAGLALDAALGEAVGVDRGPLLDQVREDVLAEVVRAVAVGGVALELLEQEVAVEHVDAHGGERGVGPPGHGRRVPGLLDEVQDPVVVVDVHHAEAAGLLARDLDAGDRGLGAAQHVRPQHLAVVHLVDVVAGQDDDVRRAQAVEDVEVLEHGVGGAAVPVLLVDALLGREEVDELAHLAAQEAPAALQVAQQAVRLVLGEHGDLAKAGVDGVRQGEVDDAQLAAEVHGRLGPPVGQGAEPAAAAAGQDEGQRATTQLAQARFEGHGGLDITGGGRRSML